MRTLMPVGGAIDKEHPVIMSEFIRRSGGQNARVLILPQASMLADTGAVYVRQCLELGAGSASSLEFRRRDEAGTEDQLKAIREATGIFFSGGAQMRIAAIMGGTVIEKELLQAYSRGTVIAGTSAGASILSKTMIAYGKAGGTPREGMVQFTPGLGFTDKYVIDQHFRQRDRIGRLIYAVAAHPGVMGIGCDEDTAAIIEDESVITVWGSGAVTLVDGSNIAYTDIADIENKGPVAVSPLTVHILTHGSVFSGNKAQIPPKVSLTE